MKVLLSFILFTLLAIGTKAQSSHAAINITFTDINSIKIADDESASISFDKSNVFSRIKGLSIFSPKGSQIKKINSQTGRSEVVYLDSQPSSEKYSSERFNAINSNSIRSIQDWSKSMGSNPLIVYQIDPR